MASQSWLETVEQELVQIKVSRAYRERLLGELQDHIEEIRCEERNHAMSAEAYQNGMLESRLGTPADVVASAKANSPKMAFACRHPLVTYLLIPIPALILLWVAYTATVAGIFSLFQEFKGTEWAVSTARILAHGIAYAPAILLTLLIARTAMRSRTNVVWWLASSAIVAFVSGMMMVSLQLPTAPGNGTLNVGLGFPPQISQWPQAIIPLAISLAFISYTQWKQPSRPDVTAT